MRYQNAHTVTATREGLVGEVTATSLKITPEAIFVALPDPSALWHTVAVLYQGRVVLAPVLDIGPWYVDNPYWADPPYRPRAETNKGQRLRGYDINGAGIDLSDGLIRILGPDPEEWPNPEVTWWWHLPQ